MTLQPGERFGRDVRANIAELLSGNCLPGLDDQDYVVMAARVSFGRPSRSAPYVGYSEGHMRRRWERLKDMMLVPVGLRRHDDLLAGMWVTLHERCCSAPALTLLRADDRFAG